MATLTIVRGNPGSGKSTYAKSLGVYMVEADMYHMKDGEYKWKPDSVSASHKWCKRQVFSAMIEGLDVVVSNTFTQTWEFVNYIDFANILGYNVKVVRCMNKFQNIHDVPEEILSKMEARFEDFNGEELYSVQ